MPRPHDSAIDDAVLLVLRGAGKSMLFAEVRRKAGHSEWEVRIALQNLQAAEAITKTRCYTMRGAPFLYAFAKPQHRPDRWSAAGLVEVWG